MKYKNIFFDLDRTLWDFDSSARIAFTEIFENHNLQKLGIKSVEDFQTTYNIHNEQLWDLYRRGKIQKEILRGKRFRLTLKDFGIEDSSLAERIGKEYIEISPLRVALFPHAEEVLEHLAPKFRLNMITNGFSEVQAVKLKSSGLGKYFEVVITSEEAGHKKPDPRIFQYAFHKAGAHPSESIMIGDDPEVDIKGAGNVGMDQVLFDPQRQYQQNGSTFYINDLIELKGIFK
jgi:putative hydrolase of the HAD superfamily